MKPKMDDHPQAGTYNWTMWSAPIAAKRKIEYDSWEEQAFAEDAAGLLGSGCVWPPRSYTCSFCRREFRSAQALGGHMNVHRRDRARLKQLPNTPQDQESVVAPYYDESGGRGGSGSGSGSGFIHSPACSKVDPNYKKCPSTTSLYNSPTPNNLFYSSSKPMSSTSFGGHNRDMQVCNFSYQHQIHDELSTNDNPEQDRHLNYGKREAKIIEVECQDHESEGSTKCVKPELSISLSLVVRRIRPEEEASCFKRRKIVAALPEPSPPLIFASEVGGVDHMSKIEIAPREVHGLFANYSSSSREIDLELRLGG